MTLTPASPTEAAGRAAEILGRPVTINGLTVPNRIAMAPMTRYFSPDGIPGPDVASYYARRAAAGVGLIITEGTYPNHPSAGDSDRVPRFYGEEQLAGRELVVGVERQGDHDEVGGLGGLRRGGGAGLVAEFGDEAGEGLRSARVAHDDVEAGGDGEAGEGAADGAASDEGDGLGHGGDSVRGCA